MSDKRNEIFKAILNFFLFYLVSLAHFTTFFRILCQELEIESARMEIKNWFFFQPSSFCFVFSPSSFFGSITTQQSLKRQILPRGDQALQLQLYIFKPDNAWRHIRRLLHHYTYVYRRHTYLPTIGIHARTQIVTQVLDNGKARRQ